MPAGAPPRAPAPPERRARAPRWRGTLRVKLVAAFLLVVLVPLVLLVSLDIRELQTALSQSARRSLRAVAAQTARSVDAFVTSNLEVIATEARLPALAEYLELAPPANAAARGRVQAILDTFTHRDRTFITSYALLDLHGRIVVDSAEDEGSRADYSEHEFFREALETGLAHVSSVEFEPQGTGQFYFSAPVLGAGARPIGVLRSRYSATVLQRLIARSSGLLGPGSFAVLVDENGLRLAHGDAAELVYLLAVPIAPERAAELAAEHRLPAAVAAEPARDAFLPASSLEAGAELSFTADLGHDRARNAGTLVPLETRPWRVVAFQPEETFLEPVRAQTRRTWAFAILLALLGSGAAMWIASLLSRPIARLTAAAGRVAGGDLTARAEPHSSDEIGRLAATFDEMTSRIRAREAALAAETERLSVTLRSIGDGVITTDVEGRVELLNGAAERLTGWTQAEARGLALSSVFGIDDENGAQLESPPGLIVARDEAGPHPGPTTLVARDGTRRLVAESAAPIRDRDGRVAGAVLVFRDVTEKQRLEAERAKIEKLESLGLLAGGIAHDLNNILAAIVGNISLMQGEAAPPHIRAEAEEMAGAARRAAALSRQLLTFSAGGAPIKKAASLAEIVEGSTRFVLHGSSVRCAFSLSPDLAPVEVDAAQMDQVVHNLVLNAVQAMPDGGTMHVGAANVTLAPGGPLPLSPGRYVEFWIRDAGSGIAERDLRKIFDPYFTTKPTGTGLGLTTVYSILKRHGGHIVAESALGQGTTFRAWLPASARVAEPAAPGGIAARTGSGRVLVMDDEEPVRRVLGRMLRRLGYDVAHARDGAEAIELYAEALRAGQRFSAVVMDLTIPGGLGGKETIRRLRALDPRVRAVVSSGYSSDPIMSEYREHGFCGVVAKPFTAEQLAEALRQALGAGEG